METIVITLPDSQRVYIEEQIRLGGYRNASEYFNNLVLEERKRQAQKRLETILIEDIESGPAEPMTAEDWEEIRRTVRKRERHPQLKEIIAKTRLGLENLYGEQLDRLILFGSQARGDARPDSDIDLLIVLKNSFDYSQKSDRISYLIADICLEHTVVISCVFATLQKYQEYDGGLFRNIRQEGMPV